MTLKDAAEVLGITPDTLRQQIANGKFRASKMGPLWVVKRKEVERYAKEHRRSA